MPKEIGATLPFSEVRVPGRSIQEIGFRRFPMATPGAITSRAQQARGLPLPKMANPENDATPQPPLLQLSVQKLPIASGPMATLTAG